ncbi:DUF6883 domain-containing protein [Achromobacter kerstersii]
MAWVRPWWWRPAQQQFDHAKRHQRRHDRHSSGRLVNAEKAVIDPNKVTSYALNSEHPVGGNKAKVFESPLGYNQSNAGGLIAKVQEGALLYPAKLGAADKFGQRITIDMPITGPNGNTATVRTGWIYDPGSSIPRMTTLYVK